MSPPKIQHTEDTRPFTLVLIDEDRYGGAYSNHSFTAWLNTVPDQIDAGDSGCEEFWKENDVVFGGGSTPDDAVADLMDKLYNKLELKDPVYNTEWTPCVEAVFLIGALSHGDVAVAVKQKEVFKILFPKSYAIHQATWG